MISYFQRVQSVSGERLELDIQFLQKIEMDLIDCIFELSFIDDAFK